MLMVTVMSNTGMSPISTKLMSFVITFQYDYKILIAF